AYVIATPEVRSPMMPGVRGDFADNLRFLKDLGYAAVEVAMRDPSATEAKTVVDDFENVGLSAAMIGSAPSELQDGVMMCHPDKDVRAAGAARLRSLIDMSVRLGALGVNIGRFRGTRSMGDLWEVSTGWMQDAFKAGGDYAAENGVKIYVEPYNRYETNFINTVEQGADYVREMNHPGIALMIDTCWMNSEDASLPGAIFKGGQLIEYVHIADSNRCYPGAGHIHFGDIIRALRQVKYTGYLTVQIDQKPEFKLVAKKSIGYLGCFI
ncbi:MAG: sugar phosphate isomerase/epimerase family protein, partial [Hyphomicrobiaceae bacterium]